MKRLAITIGGAVSLGSFEGGVVYEILRAIGQHNQHPDTTEDQKILVDVLTGASAGGMTAAIAAQKLLFEPGSLDGANGNAFYIPWVREVSLLGLLALAQDESPSLSVLSSDLVENIARTHLTDRYAAGTVPPPKLHPAAAPQIKLGLAMSNLSGVDYSIPILTGGEFVYTRFQDEFIVELDSNVASHDSQPTWEGIRNAAVACGAFPFAFRIKEVLRDPRDYPSAKLPPTLGRYAYTDGGTFQNEPLGLAKNLVDKFDSEHLLNDERHYLFVAPNLRGSVMDGTGSFPASGATFAKTAKRLITAIFNQGRYQDWVRVETVNEKIGRFDKEAIDLLDLFEDPAKAQALAAASDVLLATAYPDAAAISAATDRLRKQFASDLQAAALSQPAADQWLRAIAVLEKILGVENYDQMRVYAVSSTDEELAGACLMYFGGFFDESYREHDYQVGRQKAQEFLQSDRLGSLGPIHCDFEPLGEIDPDLANVQPHDLPLPLREQLKTQISERAHRALEELGISFAERQIIDVAFISKKLNDFLGL
jgi:hypothetical protein